MTTTSKTKGLLSIPEARAELGDIGVTTLYALVAEGALPLVKIRRRSFIRAEDVEALIERNLRVAVP